MLARKYYEISKSLGLKAGSTEEGIESLIEKIKDLMKKLNMPMTIKECEIDKDRYFNSIEKIALE